MNLKDKFDNIIYNKQRHKFHDSSLLYISLNIEKKQLILNIEFWKDRTITKNERYVIITFEFINIGNLLLNNEVTFFGVDDDIDRFHVITINNQDTFILEGNKGWVFSFTAEDFEYYEKDLEISSS